jgi:hypothetical protein
MLTTARTRRTGTKRASTKRAAAKKTSAKKKTRGTGSTATSGAAHRSSQGKRKWSAGVNTESTFPQEGLFKKDAATIARNLASKKVSPKGPSSGMRMLTFYVNRAGKNLTKGRLNVLNRAKELLHERIQKSRAGARTGRKSSQQPSRKPTRRKSHKRGSHS